MSKILQHLKPTNLYTSRFCHLVFAQTVSFVALNRNLEKIEEANKVYISNQGATLWQKKINLKNRNVAA